MLAGKNRITAPDAKLLEDTFEKRLSDLSISSVSGGVPNRDAAEAVGIDNLKSAASENGASPEPQGFRPTEVDLLIGDASKARSKLGWQHRVSFDELVAEMVAAEFKAVPGERSRVLTHAD